MGSLVFILILLVLMVPLFLTTRRQKKMQRQTQEAQANLAAGDEVMTSSGMHGEIVAVQESTVDLEIADGIVTRWEKIAIRERLTTDESGESSGDGVDGYDDDADDEDAYADYDEGSADAEDFVGDASDDPDDELDGFTEEDLEGFSADDLTPEDFFVDGDEDVSESAADGGADSPAEGRSPDRPESDAGSR